MSTIVNSWQALMEANEDETVTDIKFADGGGVIDFNNIQVTGFDTTVTFNKPIDFNNWEFRNIYFRVAGCFYFKGTITNANFLNVYSVNTSTSFGTFRFEAFNNNNITISGLFIQPRFCYIIQCAKSINDAISIQNSSFKFDILGDLDLMSCYGPSTYYYIDNCRFDFNMVWRDSAQPYLHSDYASFTNCLFTGSIYAPNIASSTNPSTIFLDRSKAANNIIDIKRRNYTSSDADMKLRVYTASSTGLNIYTNDTGISYEFAYGAQRFQGVTSAQLSQPEYLFDLGFPIAIGG